jgi:hypothetical protein
MAHEKPDCSAHNNSCCAPTVAAHHAATEQCHCTARTAALTLDKPSLALPALCAAITVPLTHVIVRGGGGGDCHCPVMQPALLKRALRAAEQWTGMAAFQQEQWRYQGAGVAAELQPNTLPTVTLIDDLDRICLPRQHGLLAPAPCQLT